MAFLALTVASDGFSLIGSSLLEALNPYAVARMQTEIIPTMIHILGIICFAVGIAISNLKATPLQYRLVGNDKSEIAFAGWVILGIGLSMKLLALYLGGMPNIFSYLDQLYDYDASIRKYGFLDQGVSIAIFGIVLIIIAHEGKIIWQSLLLITALAIAVLLSTSKSGFSLLVIPFYLITTSMSKKTLKTWTHWPVLIIVGIFFIVGLGIKTQIKYSGIANVDYNIYNISDIATSTILIRFSGSGLYEGYANLVNRISEDSSKQLNGEVILNGIILGNIPRFIYHDYFLTEKPSHPFLAKGELIKSDFSVDPLGNEAPTLVGFAFADFAMLSLIPYLTFGGIFLGIIRNYINSRRNKVMFLGYISFSAMLGPSLAESGFLNMFYCLSWAILIILTTRIIIGIKRGRILQIIAGGHRPEEHTAS